MRKSVANVVVHFPGPAGDARLGEAEQAMRSLQGVLRVTSSPRLRGLVLVDYDPAAVSAQSILAGAARSGLSGRLVGL